MAVKVEDPDSIAADLLIGCRAVATFLGLSTRQTFHQIEAGNIPTVRMGRKIVASKTTLRRTFCPEKDEVA